MAEQNPALYDEFEAEELAEKLGLTEQPAEFEMQ